MNIFLKELSKQYPNDMILLCCDGVAWHKAGSLHIPENVRLFFIPPYTLEMNLIEQIWKELRRWVSATRPSLLLRKSWIASAI